MSTTFSIPDCHLYGILDLGYVRREDVEAVTLQMVAQPDESRVDILQLRAKDISKEDVAELAREILPITQANGVPLIINDHPDIAAEAEADGVHVGQNDLKIDKVRAIVGDDAIVGKSTHSLDQAVAASRENVDYIGFGPLFATPTKPEYNAIGTDDISDVHLRVPLPIFCIGGINEKNLPEVLACGARRVVIVAGILQSSDITACITRLKSILSQRP